MNPEICVYGVDTCEDTERTRQHLEARGIPYTYINLEEDAEADRKVKEWNHGRRLTPTVIITGSGGSSRLVEPENEELDTVLRQHGLGPAA